MFPYRRVWVPAGNALGVLAHLQHAFWISNKGVLASTPYGSQR